jgi:hypothetical protein
MGIRCELSREEVEGEKEKVMGESSFKFSENKGVYIMIKIMKKVKFN